MRRATLPLATALLLMASCGDDAASPPGDAGSDSAPATDAPPSDASGVDAGFDAQVASTAHCDYAPLTATHGAGGRVEAGDLQAGAAEEVLDLPVGSALGAYTARADFMGSEGVVDMRYVEYPGAFHPSVGVESAPKARAVALTVGDQALVLVKLDVAIADDNVARDIEAALGPEYAGEVVFLASHSHSAWAQYPANTVMGVGFGRRRQRTYDRVVQSAVEVARRALASRVPARIGIFHDGDFDPGNVVSHDRREENDDLPDGLDRKDRDLFLVRIDSRAGDPIAALPVFGVHGTILGADNEMASTDAPGAIERALEESFDRQVVVMHLQGAAGDVSPSGTVQYECGGDRCIPLQFGRCEEVGRLALPMLRAAWERAGESMTDRVPLEVVTRSVPLGPDWRTFRIRSGALEYAPFAAERRADGVVFDADGQIVSPIDEFNAPVGAGLCGDPHDAFFPLGQMPGTRGVPTYRSCIQLDEAVRDLGELIVLPFEDTPICGTTRTTLSAFRLGDYLFAALPGEPVTLYADRLRAVSPYPADHTVVLGYAQGYVGYLLTVEDWLRGGYESSINVWGPLEGEYLMERAVELMQIATTDGREDAAAGGTDRWAAPDVVDDIPPPDPASLAGTVPASVPPEVLVPGRGPIASAEPDSTIPRLGNAVFVWIGEDPLSGTPLVTLQHESAPGSGTFADVTRHSGRAVADGDFLLLWTPLPLQRDGSAPRTHYWLVDWEVATPLATVPSAPGALGADGLDALADRPGVPLGRYRFHVDGMGYELGSSPFEVVPGAVTVGVARDGSTLRLEVGYTPLEGWRLLDMTGAPNRRAPARAGPITVDLTLDDGSTRSFADVAVADGGASVDAGADAARVTRVRVTDRFGNTGEASL